MLKPQTAREQLGALRSNAIRQVRFGRSSKLRKELAGAVYGIQGLLPDGKRPRNWTESHALMDSAVAAFDADPKGRAKAFDVLYPTLAVDIERGWQAIARTPYTTGSDRRPFRAPTRPELYRDKRKVYLHGVFDTLSPFPDDALSAEWLAAWAVHLDSAHFLGHLFAGVIDAGGSAGKVVFEALKDTAAGRHEIGGPCRQAIAGLLSAARPDGWAFVEQLLLAAQRQEGLRQVILESVDEAHPDAFPRMVKLILDENLVRFAAAARAAAVWLGEVQAVENPTKLKADLREVLGLRIDPAARKKAVAKGGASAAYRGLWAAAMADAEAAVTDAAKLLKDEDAGRRFAAVKLRAESGFPNVAALLVPLLDDPDQRVVSSVLQHLGQSHRFLDESTPSSERPPKDLFERLERVLTKLPAEPKELKAPVEGWYCPPLRKSGAADLLVAALGTRRPEKLIPYLSAMSDRARVQSLAKLCTARTLTAEVRQTLVAVTGEPNQYVRREAMNHLKKCTLAEDEVRTLEGYLTRKAADFRRGVFDLLLNRPDKNALATVDRLLTASDANQRAAGVELARRLVDAGRSADAVRARLRAFKEERGKRLSDADAAAVEAVLDPSSRAATLADGLGTFDPADRSTAIPPEDRGVEFATPAAIAFVTALDAFIHDHRQATFRKQYPGGQTVEIVLGSIEWGFEFDLPDRQKSPEDDRANLPLADLWDGWLADRPADTRDADGYELLRAMLLTRVAVRDGEERADPNDGIGAGDPDVSAALAKIGATERVKVRYGPIIDRLLNWFLKLHPPAGTADFLLDAAETALAAVPQTVIDKLPTTEADAEETPSNPYQYLSEDDSADAWRSGYQSPFLRALELAKHQEEWLPGWGPDHDARLFRLCRWVDEPIPGVRRQRPSLEVIFKGYATGAAAEADLYDELIGPRAKQRYGRESFDSLSWLTDPARPTDEPLAAHPAIRDAVRRVVERIVQVELARGESATAASAPAYSVNSFYGMDTLFDLIAALGKSGFVQVARWGSNENKPAVLTRLIQHVYPQPDETPAAFAAKAKEAIAAGRFPPERIRELGLVNPRWVAHSAAAAGGPGYEEAVYWFIAHTPNAWSYELHGTAKDKPESPWATAIKSRTTLSAEQRAEGLIDVAWFHKAYAAVGDDERWDAIEAAAKFLDSGQGHKKAARLADVLLGRTKKADLVAGIRTKFLKENVRLLGLLPLPADSAKRDAELADRYAAMKEYERYARGLSSLSKEPAMQAARLGMENLAVTAGYADPVRLEWAATAAEVDDLARGPVAVAVKDIAVTLSLTRFAEPEVAFEKAGKPLKSLPADAKKHPKVVDLLERKKSLVRALANSKRSLEQAMCAGDAFRGAELKQLMGHALVRPLIERLVLKAATGLGYPVKGGAALKRYDGKAVPVKAGDSWSIAHPLDLAAAGDWHEWQAECFRSERLQPFKQVFREVYALTAAEKEAHDKSERFAGQQVNETQANALFAGRGWSTREGVLKRFREAGLVAEVALDQGWTTPADAAAPAIGAVTFRRAADWKVMPLTDVPLTILSEVMRDLDLVVSVAHVGGVDPEATQSTTEMRAALLRETCDLLRLTNVTLESRHALIRGEYGKYSVHLGSGVVHKQPGGSLCVVPVNAQHRGRLFLPFADDDPRTAEVVSKVLLLARDKEIQDPTILEQIAAR